MITLTDDEQQTCLRAARYAFAAVERAIVAGQGVQENERNATRLKRLITVLERKNDNGMWRCLCDAPRSPWRHPDCLVCQACSMASPNA